MDQRPPRASACEQTETMASFSSRLSVWTVIIITADEGIEHLTVPTLPYNTYLSLSYVTLPTLPYLTYLTYHTLAQLSLAWLGLAYLSSASPGKNKFQSVETPGSSNVFTMSPRTVFSAKRWDLRPGPVAGVTVGPVHRVPD